MVLYIDYTNKKVVRLFICISLYVFTDASLHESSINIVKKTNINTEKPNRFQVNTSRLSSIRNIDINKISSKFKKSVPATAVGLTIVTWSINTVLFNTIQMVRRKIVGEKRSTNDIELPDFIPDANDANDANDVNDISDNDLPLTEEEVLMCQQNWANAIETISLAYRRGGDFVSVATDAAEKLYGYEHHDVLFKPTKASKHPFRATGHEAMSYFVGADNLHDSEKFKGEDVGFAINGGKGWEKVVFNNYKIYLNDNIATAMGTYDFTCATTGETTTAEFTFGYKRCSDGKARIFLHHSSVPYKGSTHTKEPLSSAFTKSPVRPSTEIHIHVISREDVQIHDITDDKTNNLRSNLKYLVK